jgi:hypothetical protein
MNKAKKNTLNDLAKFLEFTENQTVKENPKQSVKTIGKKNPANAIVQPSTLAPIETVSSTKTAVAAKSTVLPNEQNIMAEIEALSQQSGLSKDRILSSLMQKNLAQNSLQNFILTDLMIKGSFLLFNFWVLLKDAQKSLETTKEH